MESWDIKPRLDLPPYELNRACPITGEVTGLENHHVVRKSFTALGKEDNERLYWVELEDGEVIGNRIKLSGAAHYRLTVNKARIVYANTVYYWEEAGERVPLRWQPPTMHRSKPQVAADDQKFIGKVADRLLAEHGETLRKLGEDEADAGVGPGQECPSCHRRVPHAKKKTSPKTSVFSTRVPLDDADTFKEMVDAAAEHIGIKERPHHAYNTLLVGLALILQAPKEDLPDAA